jgi:hypothetical protein
MVNGEQFKSQHMIGLPFTAYCSPHALRSALGALRLPVDFRKSFSYCCLLGIMMRLTAHDSFDFPALASLNGSRRGENHPWSSAALAADLLVLTEKKVDLLLITSSIAPAVRHPCLLPINRIQQQHLVLRLCYNLNCTRGLTGKGEPRGSTWLPFGGPPKTFCFVLLQPLQP